MVKPSYSLSCAWPGSIKLSFSDSVNINPFWPNGGSLFRTFRDAEPNLMAHSWIDIVYTNHKRKGTFLMEIPQRRVLASTEFQICDLPPQIIFDLQFTFLTRFQVAVKGKFLRQINFNTLTNKIVRATAEINAFRMFEV